MKPWTAILAVCAMLLAGCAATVGSRVHPGMTESEVIGVGGKPVREHTLPTGDTAWEYTLQPTGYFTWRVVIGRDGRVLAQLEPFTEGRLDVEVQAYAGATPYVRFGDWPVLAACLALLALVAPRRRSR